MGAVKQKLIEMQEMYSTNQINDWIYNTPMQDEPVYKEAVLKQYKTRTLNQEYKIVMLQEEYDEEEF
jgi:hypothetical protein